MNTELIKQFNTLYRRKMGLQADLDRLKTELAELDEKIQEEFLRDGVDKITINGHTTYTSSTIWAKYGKGNKALVIDALERTPDAKDLVGKSFNSQRLSAYVRERVKEWEEQPDDQRDEHPLPKTLRDIVEWTEKTTVKVRSA